MSVCTCAGTRRRCPVTCGQVMVPLEVAVDGQPDDPAPHRRIDSMKCWTKAALALLVAVSFATPAFAQGGGASSTGTIQGRVSDAQGAVLPGVTVTATSPALIGQQTTVTS